MHPTPTQHVARTYGSQGVSDLEWRVALALAVDLDGCDSFDEEGEPGPHVEALDVLDGATAAVHLVLDAVEEALAAEEDPAAPEDALAALGRVRARLAALRPLSGP